jgi:hypothetical protein
MGTTIMGTTIMGDDPATAEVSRRRRLLRRPVATG